MRAKWMLMIFMLAGGFASAQKDFIGDFTRSPNEHIINEVDEPFTVRSVQGCVFMEGDASPVSNVLFELQGPGANKQIRRERTDASGRFGINHVPSGTYRFKTTLPSFQSEMGTVVVSEGAPKKDKIRIVLHVGV